jgi:hypothetical protein
MYTTQNLPVEGNHVFGRAMMFLASPWAGSHIRLMEMRGVNGYTGYALDATNLRGFTGVPFWLEQLTDHRDPGALAIVFNQWLCVEWEVDAPNAPPPPDGGTGGGHNDGGTHDGAVQDGGPSDGGPPDAGPPAVVRAWIDGTEILPAPVHFTQVRMLSFYLGYLTATLATPTEMWIDDVAVGTVRPGCP